jgi:hypothetical protein
MARRCSRFCVTTHATTHGGVFSAVHACKHLILKKRDLGRVVGARGFELLPQSFTQYRARSPGPRKQRPQFHFPPFPNPSELLQTRANVDRLLHTHYSRKAFLGHESGFRDHHKGSHSSAKVNGESDIVGILFRAGQLRKSGPRGGIKT